MLQNRITSTLTTKVLTILLLFIIMANYNAKMVGCQLSEEQQSDILKLLRQLGGNLNLEGDAVPSGDSSGNMMSRGVSINGQNYETDEAPFSVKAIDVMPEKNSELACALKGCSVASVNNSPKVNPSSTPQSNLAQKTAPSTNQSISVAQSGGNNQSVPTNNQPVVNNQQGSTQTANKSSFSTKLLNESLPSQPVPQSPSLPVAPPSSPQPSPNRTSNGETRNPTTGQTKNEEQKTRELQKLIQELYLAQAQVQLEATEIQRSQAVTSNAQDGLEEAANNVRVITAALKAAQETVAAAALRAQTAQLQLAAHDQLLFTARQKVDALSAQMVGLQAEEGISEKRVDIDLPALINKLREPLPEQQKPTPVPSILGNNQPVKTHYEENLENTVNNEVLPDRVKKSETYENRSAKKQEILTDEDIADLVGIISGSVSKFKDALALNPQAANSGVNDKPTNTFLTKIQNSAVNGKSKLAQSSNQMRNPKINQDILNLYESIRRSSINVDKQKEAVPMDPGALREHFEEDSDDDSDYFAILPNSVHKFQYA